MVGLVPTIHLSVSSGARGTLDLGTSPRMTRYVALVTEYSTGAFAADAQRWLMTLRLIGHYDSPFVRRVGVSLTVLGIPFERQLLSVFSNAEAMRAFNPLVRVPALVLDDGECLIDSAAILDHLDESVGPERALLPASGKAR